jgi:hypothetical protein
MPTNRIPRELFDYDLKEVEREREVSHHRNGKISSSNPKIGTGQRA